MKASRRDFEAVALALNDYQARQVFTVDEQVDFRDLVINIMNILKRSNPKFKNEPFLAACGLK